MYAYNIKYIVLENMPHTNKIRFYFYIFILNFNKNIFGSALILLIIYVFYYYYLFNEKMQYVKIFCMCAYYLYDMKICIFIN